MAGPIWSGAISFGLVTVPVKLMPAVRRQSVSFHQLHEPDGARIQHRRFCSAEEREVPREEIVSEPAAEPTEPAPDLMAALEASIARASGDGAGAGDGGGKGAHGGSRSS